MINSLAELIVAVFVASLPILAAIVRRRRRRRSAPRPGDQADLPREGRRRKRASGSERKESREEKPRRRWKSLFRRRRPAAEGLRDLEADENAAAAGGAAAPRGNAYSSGTYQRRRSRDTDRVAAAPHTREGGATATGESGAERLNRKLEKYPTLQRAILLREILGPPKGLE